MVPAETSAVRTTQFCVHSKTSAIKGTSSEDIIMARLRIGVDVGGTFTDVCLVKEQTGEVMVSKVPSTPQDSSIGILNGISLILGQAMTGLNAFK